MGDTAARPLAVLAEWHDYQARNRRANVEYSVRPSVVPLIIDSLDRNGLGSTSHLFQVPPAALAAWFPDCIDRLTAEPVVGDAS